MKDLVFLLIDDDEDDREVFAIALKRSGIPSKLLTAVSGGTAIEKFDSDSSLIPDYIFLDLNMPGMHGTVCLREIKKRPHLNKVPVIIYSTSSNPEYEKETEQLGASHYLIKPSDIQTLTYIISLIVSAKELAFALKA